VDWALHFGLHLSQTHLQRFDLFLSELKDWNAKINLVGPATEAGVVRELLLDSLIPCPHLPDSGALLDVGSGAGFPAVPIKICKPGLRVTLLEPNRKKCSFLRQVIRVAGLQGVEVVRGRIEEGGRLFHERGFQVITGRAFLPMAEMLTRCAPYLAEGGLMVLFLGRKAGDVVASCGERLEAAGLRVFKELPYVLPLKGSERRVLILIKGSEPIPG
jgi:16S rRNA (guanine527-N7)-methyltransferase